MQSTLARPAGGHAAASAPRRASTPRRTVVAASADASPTAAAPAALTPPPSASGCPLGFGAGDFEDASAVAAPTLAAMATPIPSASGPDYGAASLPLAPGTRGLPFIGETFEMFKGMCGRGVALSPFG